MICPDCSDLLMCRIDGHDGPRVYGTFTELFICKNNHLARLCNVCNIGINLRHFDEKISSARGFARINCGNNGGKKDIILFCRDVINVLPHAFCFKRDYASIAKRIYSYNEANMYDDGDDIFVWENESFTLITKYSECFQNLINILSNDAVDCSQCGYSFDSFPTLRMFQDHLAIHRGEFIIVSK